MRSCSPPAARSRLPGRPHIPRDRKRSAIERQLAEFRSSQRHTLSPEEWRAMADHMGGAAAMGGPALMGPAPADSTPAAPAEPPHHHR